MEDVHDPGHQIMNDEEIVEEVKHEGEKSDSPRVVNFFFLKLSRR